MLGSDGQSHVTDIHSAAFFDSDDDAEFPTELLGEDLGGNDAGPSSSTNANGTSQKRDADALDMDLDEFDFVADEELDAMDAAQTEGDGDANAEAAVKKKKPAAKRVKMTEDLILGENGLPLLHSVLKSVKFKGKGYESYDLRRLILAYEMWAHRLMPGLHFDDFTAQISRKGTGVIRHFISVMKEEAMSKRPDEGSYETLDDEEAAALEQAVAEDERRRREASDDENMDAVFDSMRGSTTATTAESARSSAIPLTKKTAALLSPTLLKRMAENRQNALAARERKRQKEQDQYKQTQKDKEITQITKDEIVEEIDGDDIRHKTKNDTGVTKNSEGPSGASDESNDSFSDPPGGDRLPEDGAESTKLKAAENEHGVATDMDVAETKKSVDADDHSTLKDTVENSVVEDAEGDIVLGDAVADTEHKDVVESVHIGAADTDTCKVAGDYSMYKEVAQDTEVEVTKNATVHTETLDKAGVPDEFEVDSSKQENNTDEMKNKNAKKDLIQEGRVGKPDSADADEQSRLCGIETSTKVTDTGEAAGLEDAMDAAQVEVSENTSIPNNNTKEMNFDALQAEAQLEVSVNALIPVDAAQDDVNPDGAQDESAKTDAADTLISEEAAGDVKPTDASSITENGNTEKTGVTTDTVGGLGCEDSAKDSIAQNTEAVSVDGATEVECAVNIGSVEDAEETTQHLHASDDTIDEPVHTESKVEESAECTKDADADFDCADKQVEKNSSAVDSEESL
ncbi:hypothetical protein SARC_01026 [Sphaeroforma arctica JP610]|uniref:Chromosome segregation in meiosis protein 3 domain-containing protein n=1 Tax=Sphaeroforma arctica JP610 TaxID=667725 RepID=A0A0L0GEW4_9EUKA|nr:hypothetical protein SARC_01026 [Sphaeroforma arctica JP610]KNC86833.1 hypothetical protein SARC_01026 [Sphaeroforma arctica JP610]|eukprot:XP_014160735.1 hypothetical protein SARC_01026 [Sphaeroforma arctica JP610]